MRDKWVLVFAAVAIALGGWLARAGDAWRMDLDGDGARLLLGLTAGHLCFLWYVADSDERGFTRPRWLGAAMIVLAPVAVPWYLMRSRAGSPRVRALLGYAGCVGLCMLSARMAALLR